MKLLNSILCLCLFCCFSNAQQLKYKPINPAFGGDTFNYQWLQQSATAQNKLQDPSRNREELSELDEFSEALNRQLLSQLSRSLLDLQLDTDNLSPGTFTFGNLEVEVLESLEGLIINILDTNTGDTTQVVVPGS